MKIVKTALLTIVCCTIVGVFATLEAGRDREYRDALAAHLDDYCTVEREMLGATLRHSFPGPLHDPSYVAYAYQALEGSQWRQEAPCVPKLVELRGFCSPGDESCVAWTMLNAIRWMWVR
ncbi:MAG: hypothetical protein ABI591_00235 [Kofleriaceae bacterium]